MGLLNLKNLKGQVASVDFAKLKEKATNIKGNIADKVAPNQDAEDGENKTEKQQSAIMSVLDWGFDKVTGNVPGFGSAQDMAEKYLAKKGNIADAADCLIKWQMTSAATAGFVTSLGGLPSMVVTLPANIAGVIAVQLRMIGGIAVLGGCDFKDEDTKTGMYLCLLGTEAGSVLSKTASQFAVKFTTAALKKLPGSVLTKINQAVGFRLVTKFGSKGLINLGKAIPLLGGVVGGAVDAFSTYGISQAAKSLFLAQAIDLQKNEAIDMEKMRIIINMSLVDGECTEDEKIVLRHIAGTTCLQEKAMEQIMKEIEQPKRHEIDLSLFKDDDVLACSLISGLSTLVKADGVIAPPEKMYLIKVGTGIGMDAETLKLMLS